MILFFRYFRADWYIVILLKFSIFFFFTRLLIWREDVSNNGHRMRFCSLFFVRRPRNIFCFFCFLRFVYYFWRAADGLFFCFLFIFFFRINRITFEIFWPENFIALREAAQRRDERLRTLTLTSTLTGMQHRDTREASRLIKTPCVLQFRGESVDWKVIPFMYSNFPRVSRFTIRKIHVFFIFKFPSIFYILENFFFRYIF